MEQLWQQIKQRFLSNTTFQNYDDIIERSCQAWNEILSEIGFIKNCVVEVEFFSLVIFEFSIRLDSGFFYQSGVSLLWM
ncbi:hypothetical protein BSPWISOXPB_1473 [uncultured Gammaproteobacteria bacterium]|nr:hypothetical protein BSPWISOXPB_1473 [uncultured Gammaproteobacteria bacterium]